MNNECKEYIDFTNNIYGILKDKISKNDYPRNFRIDDKISYNGNGKDYNLCGESDVFGNISLYMNNILRRAYDDNLRKTLILEVIIHELMHINQLIDFTNLNDWYYNSIVEYGCTNKTFQFVEENKDYLSMLIGGEIVESVFSSKVQHQLPNFYVQKTLFDAYNEKLKFIFKNDDMILKVLLHDNVGITYNGQKLPIKLYGSFSNFLIQFNNIIYDYYISHNNYKYSVSIDDSYNKYTLINLLY